MKTKKLELAAAAIDKASAEALEEAAKVLESCKYADDDLIVEARIWNEKMATLVGRIRALKGKP